MKPMIIWALTTWVMCLAFSSAAQTPALDTPKQTVEQVLAPFETMLKNWPPVLRERLEQHAEAWVSLTPEQQALLRENLTAWDNLEPQQKLALRERFDAWEHMDKITRRAAVTAVTRYAKMSEEEKLARRAEFEALSAAERQRYMFDPSTRTAMDLASELFRFVPSEEHLGTLEMLRELTPLQVSALRAKLSRMPPPQRNAYRQRLLAMTAEERVEELQLAK